MRKILVAALLAAICALCACEPAPSASVASAEQTSVTPALPGNTGAVPARTGKEDSDMPTMEPAVSPEHTAEPVKDFPERVAAGLEDRWEGRQAIVVVAGGVDSSDAELWLYEKNGSYWKAVEGPWPAMVGKNGMSKQAEGDGRAPSGVFLLGTAFGTEEKPDGAAYQYRKLDSSDRWVDDRNSPFYNRWVRGTEKVCGNGENLSRIEQYRHAVVIHYNDRAETERGSAIFLHVWKDPGQPTLGCTAISRENMVELLRWLDYAARPVLVQGTEEQIGKLMEEDWGLLCLPEGWGFVDDFLPDVQPELRYFKNENFTGNPVPGYEAPLAPMRMEAIEALAKVAGGLKAKKLGIRIFDAYRPQKATDAMIAWAEDETDTATKEEYYPGIEKADIPGHYVARKSGHRMGGTVDLTLLSWKDGEDLEMGGPFDFFGEMSSFGYRGLTKTQSANREKLRSLMSTHGFNPYDKEWWHFSLTVEGEGGTFIILPREHMCR